MRRPSSVRLAVCAVSAAASFALGAVAAPAASADPPCTGSFVPGSSLPCTSAAHPRVPHLTDNLGRRFG